MWCKGESGPGMREKCLSMSELGDVVSLTVQAVLSRER